MPPGHLRMRGGEGVGVVGPRGRPPAAERQLPLSCGCRPLPPPGAAYPPLWQEGGTLTTWAGVDDGVGGVLAHAVHGLLGGLVPVVLVPLSWALHHTP